MNMLGFPTKNKVPKMPWRDTNNRWPIEDLFEIADEQQVGIVPSEHGCVVIDCDVDGVHQGVVNFTRKFFGIAEHTMWYKTSSGGGHLWFKVPEGIKIPQRTRIIPLVDIRHADGYVCIGRDYKIHNEGKPAPCPDNILEWLTTPANKPDRQPEPHRDAIPTSMVYRLDPIPKGQRNDALYRQGCGLFLSVRKGELLDEDARAILEIRGYNSGLEYSEVQKIIERSAL
jgi:hypothetical protein